MTQEELIKGCIESDPHLMEQFYKIFAPKMWVVCLRYTRNSMMAEDVMQEGFIRAYSQLPQFTGKGSLEGWLRRIFISTAINFFKKYYRFDKQEEHPEKLHLLEDRNYEHVIGKMHTDQMLEMLETLSPGYKLVFNLFAIEGYTHKEIGEMLGCSVGTSKSQLARARAQLQQLLEKLMENENSEKKILQK